MPRRPFRPRHSYAPHTYRASTAPTYDVVRHNQLAIQALEDVLQARDFKSLLQRLRRLRNTNARSAVEYYYNAAKDSINNYHRLLQEDSSAFDGDPNGEAYFDEIYNLMYSRILEDKQALSRYR